MGIQRFCSYCCNRLNSPSSWFWCDRKPCKQCQSAYRDIYDCDPPNVKPIDYIRQVDREKKQDRDGGILNYHLNEIEALYYPVLVRLAWGAILFLTGMNDSDKKEGKVLMSCCVKELCEEVDWNVR